MKCLLNCANLDLKVYSAFPLHRCHCTHDAPLWLYSREEEKGGDTINKFYTYLESIIGKPLPNSQFLFETNFNKLIRTTMRLKWTFWDIFGHFGTSRDILGQF